MRDSPIRIAVLLAQYPPKELDLRTAAVARSAGDAAEINFRRIEGSVYKKGLTNLDRALVAPTVARAASEAESAGCHAVVPYGTLDLGVEEARHVVDIPVMGPGRTGSHVAATVADRFAILCYDQAHVVMFRKLTRGWGVDSNVTSIREVGIPITSMAENVGRLRKAFVAEAKAAAKEDGAELILPLGMTMVPVLLDSEELSADIGLPVLDPLAVTLRVAAGLAATGFTNSRAAYPLTEVPG
jgi:allantoin racemase